ARRSARPRPTAVGVVTACVDCPEGMERGPMAQPPPTRRLDTPLCRVHARERMQTEAVTIPVMRPRGAPGAPTPQHRTAIMPGSNQFPDLRVRHPSRTANFMAGYLKPLETSAPSVFSPRAGPG